MYYILLFLNLAAVISLLFCQHRKSFFRFVIIVLISFILISFHEKHYYLGVTFLFELYFIHKFNFVLIENEEPSEEKKPALNYFIFITSFAFFLSLVTYFLMSDYQMILLDSLSFDFGNIEVFKIITLALSAILLIVLKRRSV